MDWKIYFNRTVILGALALAGVLLLVTLLLTGLIRLAPQIQPEVGFAPADLTLIPAPTHTPAIAPVTPEVNVTPTLAPEVVGVGAYVQVSGTEGEGIRVRAAPGLSGDTVFFAGESEVFVVRDGPQTADNYVWWYLVTPYDNARAGWAAANFLSVIPAP